MSLKLTILGCGNSEGVPMIGNYWGNCDPEEPKNRRTRPSVAVQSEKSTLIIDTGPDFKYQVNKHNINDIDAVLYTHAHADHVSGIDELRGWVKRIGMPLNVYGNDGTIQDLRRRYDYHFEQKSVNYPAVLVPNVITDEYLGQAIQIGDIELTAFAQDHGSCTSLGFRFGDVAYSTDLIDLPEASIECLKGIRTWIIDAAGYTSTTNPVHLSLQKVFDFNEVIKAQKVYLTHMSHYMDYQTLIKDLPDGYEPAYDGLVLST